VDTKAYAECDVDLALVKGGVGGKLTLLKDNFDLGAKIGIGVDRPDPYFFAEYWGRNTLETLSGSLYAFAEVDLVFWSNRWPWDIYSWSGLKLDGFVILPERYEVDLYTGQTPGPTSLEKKLKLTIKRIELIDPNMVNRRKQYGASDFMVSAVFSGFHGTSAEDRKGAVQKTVPASKGASVVDTNTVLEKGVRSESGQGSVWIQVGYMSSTKDGKTVWSVVAPPIGGLVSVNYDFNRHRLYFKKSPDALANTWAKPG
jgi:hypothetical protein